MYFPLNEDFLPQVITCQQVLDVTTVYEQGSGENNEDRLLAEDGIYGVFDGATSLEASGLVDGLSGGGKAAQIAADTFRNGQKSLVDTAIEANSRIAISQGVAGVDMQRRESLWSTSIAVVRFVQGQLEFCQTGDSLIMLLGNDGSHSLLTPEVDIDSETMKLWQSAGCDTSQSIYSVLRQQIRKVRLNMNREYGVLNGEPEAIDFLNYGSVSLDSVTDVILFTDGLFLPKKDPEQPTDWSVFSTMYRRDGLVGVKKYVKDIQSADPTLKVYPRFKRHDDIAAVSIHLSSTHS